MSDKPSLDDILFAEMEADFLKMVTLVHECVDRIEGEMIRSSEKYKHVSPVEDNFSLTEKQKARFYELNDQITKEFQRINLS